MTLQNYQLGQVLGKGAWGIVYQSFNWTTGETVAIKQINLASIPKSESKVIMLEIDLLKNLNHPNIVKYIGYTKTKEFLYIILDKRYGSFPENLVAVYIAQVLEGLLYLHEQGVIHRDIKGANILTTKDGSVKLADFGVATKTSTLTDFAVVGSPYWMAPEIIELSGATTASDIWSLGCVVIELISGNPPYHYLDAMPALFRIVQDDHPPIPEGASPIVKDFLMQCFQKDANLRVSAKKLLKHPWIINSKKNQARQNRPETFATKYDNAIKTVQEWNEALRVAPSSSTMKFVPKTSPAVPRAAMISSRINVLQVGSSAPVQKSKTSSRPLPKDVVEEKDEEDDWEGDFDNLEQLGNPTLQKGSNIGDVSVMVSHIPFRSSPLNDGTITPTQGSTITTDTQRSGEVTFISTKLSNLSLEEDGQSTIRPKTKITPRSPLPKMDRQQQKLPSSPQPSSSSSLQSVWKLTPKSIRSRANIVIEDYSDVLGSDQDVSKITSKVISIKRQPQTSTTFPKIFHPSDLQALKILPNTIPSEVPLPSSPPSTKKKLPFKRPILVQRDGTHVEMTDFTEPEEEDYGDLLGQIFQSDDAPPSTMYVPSDGSLRLNTKLSGSSWLGDEGSDDEDPFAEIDEGYDETDLETNLARDKYARLCATVDEYFDSLRTDSPESKVKEACDGLLDILTETPEMKQHLTSSHGVLPIVEMLEDCDSRELAWRLLQIVNILMKDNVEMQENLCLVGGLPVIMEYASKRYPENIRMGAAAFLSEMCHTSTLTLQMFISCKGPKVLVELLDEAYSEQKALIWMAVNGIWSVFTLQSPTSKSEFCRIFLKKGLLDPLSTTLHQVLKDKDPEARICLEKLVNIILFLSQADSYAKDMMSTRSFIRQILHQLESLPAPLLVIMLKTIRNLSTNSNSLDVLQNADAIDVLTRVLANRKGPQVNEISNQILATLYNLCRINKSRQEEAVQAGLIPHLQYFVRINSPLKQFCLPILCDIPHASKQCRKALWQFEGLKFYLDLMNDPYWQVNALEAILVWLQDETAKVEGYLISNDNGAVNAILQAFITAKTHSFEHFLDPLYKVLRLSRDLVANIAQPEFFQRLLDRLGHHKAIVRLNLLRLLKCICEMHPMKDKLIEKYELAKVIEKIRNEDGAVLVCELAREILEHKSFERRPSRRSQSSSLLHRRTVTMESSDGGLSSKEQSDVSDASTADEDEYGGLGNQDGDMFYPSRSTRDRLRASLTSTRSNASLAEAANRKLTFLKSMDNIKKISPESSIPNLIPRTKHSIMPSATHTASLGRNVSSNRHVHVDGNKKKMTRRSRLAGDLWDSGESSGHQDNT